MHFTESFRIALHCMKSGRVRTVLTMLGIVISVAAIIAGDSLSAGLRNTYRDEFDSMFTSISITPKAAAAIPGGNRPRSLRDSDIDALTRQANPELIADVVPIVSGPVVVRRGSDKFRANVIGATPGYLRMRNYPVTEGVVFTAAQYQREARVVLLGPLVIDALFAGNRTAAIGSTVQIGRVPFEVVGTLGGAATLTALVPMPTARGYLFGGMHTVGSIGIVATHMGTVNAAIRQVNNILDEQHFVKVPGQRDYVASAEQTTGTLAIQLLAVLVWLTRTTTGIALLIGTLGLANIMFITVTERTNEIGVRRAIGARRAAILRQFLLEAVLIAGIGGAIGVGVGVAAVIAGQRCFPVLAPVFGIPELSIQTLAAAFGLSLLVGLLAGTYPALRASRLHPWNALRY